MKNPFSKKNKGAENSNVYDGVSVNILSAADSGNGLEEVDVVEIFDENGEAMVFELLAKANYLGVAYFLMTPYIAEIPEKNEKSDVFVMKEVFKGTESMLEPLEDESLVKRIFNAFRKAAGDTFDFLDK